MHAVHRGVSHRVQKFDPSGRVLLAFGRRGSDPAGNGMFWNPSDLAIDDQGYLFVTDTFNNRVQVFDHDGTFVRRFGTWGRDPGQLIKPRGIAIDAEGRVFVTEIGGNRLQVFDREGRHLAAFGSEGRKDGQFDCPYGVVVLDHELLVADNQNRRIVRLGLG
jgi:DNA-binding beta-propeller fold protein YncE